MCWCVCAVGVCVCVRSMCEAVCFEGVDRIRCPHMKNGSGGLKEILSFFFFFLRPKLNGSSTHCVSCSNHKGSSWLRVCLNGLSFNSTAHQNM